MIHRFNTRLRSRHTIWRWALALPVILALGLPTIAAPTSTRAATLTVTNGDDSGPGSLRQTILDSVAGDTIDFAPDVITVTLTTVTLDIVHDLTIAGSGQGGVTVQRSSAIGTNFTIFTVHTGVTATLQSLTIANGIGSKAGGILNDVGTLTLSNCVVAGNISFGNGGGILNDGGALTLANSSVSGNVASGGGGGIFSEAGTLMISSTEITNNTSSGADGGGISTVLGTMSMFNSTLTGNRADRGGGIAIANGTATLSGDTIADNSVDVSIGGGIAILLAGTQVTLANSTVSANTAVNGGGGIYNEGTATVANSTINNNSLPADNATGGGLYNQGTSAVLNLSRSTVHSNATPGEFSAGGGLYNFLGTATLTDSTITLGTHHNVTAKFVAAASFDDVTGGAAFTPVTELAGRGTILGYNADTYGPNDGVQRAQMAALITRATPEGPGTPTNGTLSPPNCVVSGSWDCEDWGTIFTDQGSISPILWHNAGTLQHYGVALGYTAADCAARGRAFPCYGPTDPVSHAQTIAFITRAMIAKGYWEPQPNAPLPYNGVPAVLATEVRTFHFYTGVVPDAPTSAAGWNGPATRGWFAQALWAALDSYWGTDGNLPDGNAAGGNVP